MPGWKISESAREQVCEIARQAAKNDGWMQPDYKEAKGVDFPDFVNSEREGWEGTTQFQVLYDSEIIRVADAEESRITGEVSKRGEAWLQSIYLELRDVFWEEWNDAVGIYAGWKAQED